LSAAAGMLLSGAFNLPSGSSIVLAQLVLFLMATFIPKISSFAVSFNQSKPKL